MASDIRTALSRAAASTGGGSQDFTFTPDAGVSNWTPKLAIFRVTQATADGTVTNNAVYCIGAVSGSSNLGCVFGSSNNGAGATAATRNLRNDRVMLLRNGAGTALLSASFTSFITNGVRINWSTTPVGAYLVTVEFWGGADLRASVDIVTLSTQNTAVDVTAPNFPPTLLRTLHASTAHNGSSEGDFAVCEGVALPSGTQLCWSVFDTDGADPSATAGAVYSTRCAAQVTGTTYQVEASSFDSQGYSLTARGGNSSGDQVVCIAIDTGDRDVYAGAFDSASATGSQVTTVLGFKPQIAGLSGLAVTSMDSVSTNGAGSACFSAVIRANLQYTNRFSIEDAEPTTDTECETDDIAVKLSDDGGTALHAATLTSFDASGLTLNYSAANGTLKWILWAVQAAPVTVTAAVAIDVQSSIAATLKSTRGAASLVAAATSLSATMKATRGVASVAAVASSLSAGMKATRGGSVACPIVSDASAGLKATRLAAAQSAIESIASASMNAVRGVSSLASVQSDATATAKMIRGVASQASIQSALDGSMKATRSASAQCEVESLASAILKATRGASSEAVIASALSSPLKAIRGASFATSIQSELSATLTIVRYVSSIASITSSLSASMKAQRGGAADVEIESFIAGTLKAIRGASSTAEIVSVLRATLRKLGGEVASGGWDASSRVDGVSADGRSDGWSGAGRVNGVTGVAGGDGWTAQERIG